MPANRPLGVIIFTVIALIYCIQYLFVALFIPFLYGFFVSYYSEHPDGVDAVLESEIGIDSDSLENMIAIVTVASVAYGVVYLITAWGLWTGRKWAWWLQIILSVMQIFLALRNFEIDYDVFVGAAAIWYFLKPHVKEYFDVDVNYST